MRRCLRAPLGRGVAGYNERWCSGKFPKCVWAGLRLGLVKSPAALIGIYAFLAGITWVEGEAGQGLAGRIALPDLFGLLIIGVAVIQVLFGFRGRLPVPRTYRTYVLLLIVYVTSASFSLQPMRGLFELLVHLFIFVVSISIYSVLLRAGEDALADVFQAVLVGAAMIATVGLLHFFFFPSLFAGSHGGLSGTFRNTGQAGSYFGLMLALLLPAFMCGLLRPTFRNIVLLLLIVIALAFTFKRAAMLGFVFGFVVFFGRLLVVGGKKQKIVAVIILVSALPLYGLFSFLVEYAANNVSGVAYRMTRKISADALDDFSSGFFVENMRASFEAMKMRPVFGIGLSNASGLVTDGLEIHGSYFAVLAYGGILGLAFYLMFLVRILYISISRSGLGNIHSRYLYYSWPFFLGLVGSWIYTYPLRKREFWIMLAIVSVVVAFARAERQYSTRRGGGAGFRNPGLEDGDVHR